MLQRLAVCGVIVGRKHRLCVPVQVVVLWVGTNNYQHTAEQVAGGILAIAELLHSRLPKAKIIVLVSHFANVFLVHQSCVLCMVWLIVYLLMLRTFFFFAFFFRSVAACRSCALSLTRTLSLSLLLLTHCVLTH